MDISEIRKQLDQFNKTQNNTPRDDFEGYSPIEMNLLLNFTHSANSPFHLLNMADNEYKNIPIFNQIKYLGDILTKDGEIKLTKTGTLPTKIVSDLYAQDYIKDSMIEKGITKLRKEKDSLVTHLPRIIMELSGLVKKRNDKLSLTKVAPKILANNQELLKNIWEAYTIKFNWAYNDGYEDNRIGKMGYAFTLILIDKYGDEERGCDFYAEKYFKAFLILRENSKPSYSTIERYTNNCFSLRTIDVFMRYFGLLKINEEKSFMRDSYKISKSDIFDKLIHCEPPLF